MCCLEGALIYSQWIVMMCATESALVWWQARLILPAEKFAEISWVKKASPYWCPLLKSSLNSANCRERLFKEATLGAEDKSIYLRVKTPQCLPWTRSTPGTRSLGWRCWESRGWCLSHWNVAHIKSITRWERIPPVTSQCWEEICSPGHSSLWMLI